MLFLPVFGHVFESKNQRLMFPARLLSLLTLFYCILWFPDNVEDPDALMCKNVSIQRGLQKKLSIAGSQVGTFILFAFLPLLGDELFDHSKFTFPFLGDECLEGAKQFYFVNGSCQLCYFFCL